MSVTSSWGTVKCSTRVGSSLTRRVQGQMLELFWSNPCEKGYEPTGRPLAVLFKYWTNWSETSSSVLCSSVSDKEEFL
jgi:hypothetical protein